MLRRLLTMGVRSYVGGPGKSWVFTSLAMMLFRFVSKSAAKTEMIDLSQTRPGDRIVIEHLNITHKEQMRNEKKLKKSDKALAKESKRQAKASKRDARAARKLSRQT